MRREHGEKRDPRVMRGWPIFLKGTATATGGAVYHGGRGGGRRAHPRGVGHACGRMAAEALLRSVQRRAGNCRWKVVPPKCRRAGYVGVLAHTLFSLEKNLLDLVVAPEGKSGRAGVYLSSITHCCLSLPPFCLRLMFFWAPHPPLRAASVIVVF